MTVVTREQIAEVLRGSDPEGAAEIVDYYFAQADAVIASLVDPRDALIDQGITRLQLLSFLRGEHSARWNGGDLKWVVYRRHQIDRECSPDATIIRLAYTGHQTGTDTAVIEAVPGSDVDAATALRVIDTIIDAAIAHHGPDGVA